MHTAAITLALPSLPIIGAAAFASLIAAEGYRTLLSGMFNKRAVTLNEIYDKRLKNANIKLQKIETKAKAKFDVKTGKRSTRYDKKITRQNKRINRIKRRIVHVNKTRTPFTSDVMAAALQALATLVIVSCGGQITAVVGMGIITFLLTKLANKFSKKNMGGLNV
jgi:predicted tellurium resistance membrane protein TerC